MAIVYKLTLRATAGGQDLYNIFYYGHQNGTDVGQAVALRQACATAFWAHCGTGLRALVTGAYTANSIVVTCVNERGETTTPFETEITISGNGTRAGESGTQATVAIIAFQCQAVLDTQSFKVPRRTYVAIGPIPEADILASGALTASLLLAVQTVGNLLDDPITNSSGDTLIPMRSGSQTEKNPLGSQGKIVSAIARPYSSYRRSRMLSPQGV